MSSYNSPINNCYKHKKECKCEHCRPKKEWECEHECRKECEKECREKCERECRKECEKECKKECECEHCRSKKECGCKYEFEYLRWKKEYECAHKRPEKSEGSAEAADVNEAGAVEETISAETDFADIAEQMMNGEVDSELENLLGIMDFLPEDLAQLADKKDSNHVFPAELAEERKPEAKHEPVKCKKSCTTHVYGDIINFFFIECNKH